MLHRPVFGLRRSFEQKLGPASLRWRLRSRLRTRARLEMTTDGSSSWCCAFGDTYIADWAAGAFVLCGQLSRIIVLYKGCCAKGCLSTLHKLGKLSIEEFPSFIQTENETGQEQLWTRILGMFLSTPGKLVYIAFFKYILLIITFGYSTKLTFKAQGKYVF